MITIILLIQCILVCFCDAKKSYIFVSGWPQSGTSLLQQMFTVTPNVSTMVDNCNKYMGNKCINVNHEVSSSIAHYKYMYIYCIGTMDDRVQSFVI